ncbi:MAG: hypothetical protein LBT52_00035 [Clostridiales Family XIII bacterium]|jgi:pilus assembly protein TadC|nr:hypothetical protein [Clostridiales Family XIII bacterium]
MRKDGCRESARGETRYDKRKQRSHEARYRKRKQRGHKARYRKRKQRGHKARYRKRKQRGHKARYRKHKQRSYEARYRKRKLRGQARGTAVIRFDSYTVISIISAAIYLLLLAGILLLMRERIARLFGLIRNRRRLDASRRPAEDPTGINRHLTGLLSATMKKPLSPTGFLTLLIAMFFIVFTASATNLPPALSGAVALAFSALPYLFLRVKLERIRTHGSYEGENLVSALLTQYWIAGGNIFGAIERTIETAEGIPVTRRLLSALLIEMRSTGSLERIRGAADTFAYGIGTNWGRMLAYNIRTAAVSGSDVSLAIEDILSQLREARALAEERKRINSESVRLVVFLIPVSYLGSFFVSVTLLGLSPARFIRNQFATAEGFGFFVAAVFLFFMNLVLIEVITNRKLDF